MSVQIISNEGAVQPPAFTPLLVNSINPMNFRNGLSQYLEFSKAALKASALSLFTYTFCYLFGLFHIYFLLSIHQLMEIPRIVVISSTSCYFFFGGGVDSYLHGNPFFLRWETSFFPGILSLTQIIKFYTNLFLKGLGGNVQGIITISPLTESLLRCTIQFKVSHKTISFGLLKTLWESGKCTTYEFL